MPIPITHDSAWELSKSPIVYPASLRPQQYDSVIIEIGPGRGDFLFHLSQSHPKSLVVAIEIKRKRVDRLVKRIERRKISNIMLVQSDARDALPVFFDDASIDQVHIQFPDPWPKNRHAKNRAIDEHLLGEIVRILKPQAEFHFLTDHAPYAIAVSEQLVSISELINAHDCPIVWNPENAFPTLFYTRWIEMEKRIAHQYYTRKVE